MLIARKRGETKSQGKTGLPKGPESLAILLRRSSLAGNKPASTLTPRLIAKSFRQLSLYI